MNMTDYGKQLKTMQETKFPELAGDDKTAYQPQTLARITAVHRERYQVVCEYGELYARLKTKEYYGGDEIFPTAGDYVLIRYIENGDSQIMKTLPRKTLFSRLDPTPGRGEQAVAANFDYVFIMQSLNQDFNEKRLERYLAQAWRSGATPVIVLTKADLTEDYESYVYRVESEAPGVDVCVVSAFTGFGLDSIRAYMQPGKTAVFLGSSGIGKSSLVNALAGEEIMKTNEIREDDSKGRHTTTHRQLILLENGSMIIDTPGMRELGMWDSSSGIAETFADVEQYLGKCRFADCKHETEPGCVIRAAIEAGDLSEERFRRYTKLKNEAAYSEDKLAYMKKKAAWHKDVAKKNRARKEKF